MKRTKIFAVAVLILTFCTAAAEAHNSKAWQDRIDARTATIWVEAQSLGDGIVLNARGQLDITWIERDLIQVLEKDRDVDEWVVTNLSWYSSSRKDTQAKVKGRDVLVLSYRAVKYWNFDPALLVVNGRAITSDDILTKPEYWDMGELSPGSTGIVAVAVPRLKPKQKVEIQYGDDRTTLEIPSR